MSKIRTIKITIKERKGKTIFDFCGNGKKTLEQADRMRDEGDFNHEEFTLTQKGFLHAIHALYETFSIPEVEDENSSI